ncbi:type II toxin-antitoxin system Phd/YefM family antitoxin [Agromyces bauzanensis]|uniref:Antitoxin n=1 Tax=Agromyces bauzanensis TaxID=1308924 RepID=A0A917UW31_9MICO|nr:type II toxin-antitoxin system Phd/YefM family antitoxin [Agromyces bauzanensis]GGJ88954.1 antitoxin [Agromyces bauzanensis]
MSTVTSRDFNNDVAAAKRRAAIEPVIITDRGRPSFVLMSMSEFTRLRGPRGGIVDALRMSEGVSFEVPRVDLELRVPEL